MNNTINSLREQIDLIDDEMTSLLVRRLNVCAEIAEEKRLSGAPVENLSREREVLARVKDFAAVLVNSEPETKSSPVSLEQSGTVTQWW